MVCGCQVILLNEDVMMMKNTTGIAAHKQMNRYISL